MIDKTLGIFALLFLIGFLSILVIEVPRIDLGGVIVAAIALGGYDFLIRKSSKGR